MCLEAEYAGAVFGLDVKLSSHDRDTVLLVGLFICLLVLAGGKVFDAGPAGMMLTAVSAGVSRGKVVMLVVA